MSSAQIQAKIKRGLAKAVNKTGSSSSELVYLVQVTTITPGSPVSLPVTSETTTLLVNAIFKSYDKSLLGGNIVAGDRQLICDNEVIINVGDIIKQGATNYIVIDLGESSPTSDVLNYNPQVREQ